MTTRRRVFGIKSMLEFRLQLLQSVKFLFTHGRGADASKQQRKMHFRPCLEILEDRTLLSITASIDVQALAQSGVTGQGQTNESTANPGTATATYQSGNDTATATSTGSYQIKQLGLTESANISADEQDNDGQAVVAQGTVTLSGSVVALTPEIVDIDFNFQYTHSSATSALGYVDIYFTPASEPLGANPVFEANGADLDNDSGVQYSSPTSVSAGTYSFGVVIVASAYSPVNSGPMSASLGLTISEVPQTSDTTTSLTAAPNPSTYGQAVTFTANVAPTNPGWPTPTGTVDFLDGSKVIDTEMLDSSGQASFSTSSLAIGNHQITAQYLGDIYNNGSTSSPVTQTVSQIGTTTTLLSSPDPSYSGQQVTFTATVTPASSGPAAPSGSVTFMDGASFLGSATLGGTGTATLPTSTLAVGDHPSITAVYNGDDNYIGSTSGPVDQLVSPDPTTTILTSSDTPSVYGQTVTFTATVTASNGDTPTGSVDFTDTTTGQDLGTTTLQLVDGVAQASVTVSSLTATSHVIEAAYTSDNSSAFADSSSPTLTQVVNPATPMVSVSDASDTYNGNPFSAIGTAVGVDGETPVAGNFAYTYYDGTSTSGASLGATAPTNAGTYTVVATFTSSDSNYGNNSAQTTFIINPLPVILSGSRTYDGTTTAAASILSITNLVSGDDVTLSGSATLASANAGLETITDFAGLTLGGTAAGNYTLSGASGSVNINSRLAVTLSGSRTYDGTTTAAASILSITNLVSGDDVTMSGSATLASANAGLETITDFAGLTLEGIAAGNYTLSGASGSVNITPATPTLSVIDGGTYNGQPFAAAATAVGVDGETPVAGSFAYTYYDGTSTSGASLGATAPTNAGTYTVVATFTSSESNYSNNSAQTTFIINPLPVILSGSRTYDGTTTAAASILSITNLVSGDNITLSGSATLASANAGRETISSFAGLTLGGTAAGNYTLSGASGSVNITPAIPTLSVSDAGGSYNGQPFAATATAVGVDGKTPVAGSFLYTYYTGNNASGPPLAGVPVNAGTYTALANFSSSDPNYTGGSAQTTFNIRPAATTVSTVNLSTSTAVYGQPVTLKVTVTNIQTSASPSGIVAFFDGTTDVGTAPVGAGIATVTVSTLGVGKHSLTASFSDPAGNFIPSVSPKAVSLTIVKASTTTSLTTSTSSSVYGQAVTFTANVAPVAPSGATPAGSVTFTYGSTTLATVALSGGIASYTTSKLVPGSYSVTATYKGNADFNTSASTAETVTVSQDATTAVVTSSVSSPVFGQSVTLKVTVTAAAPGSGTPTGSVTFYDGTVVLGTATLNGSGVATLKTTALTVGSNSITVVYNGDSNFRGSTSAVLAIAVSQDGTTTKLTSSSSTASVGQSVTFTATVLPASPGSGTPTGTVTFWDGSVELGTMNLGGGVATFSWVFTTTGKHKITAVYSGDSNFLSSTSSVLTETIS